MREDLPVRRMLVDAAAMAVLVAGAGLAFGPAYGGMRFLIALAVGAIVGAVVAVGPALLRWPSITTVPLLLVGFLLFGGLAAAPSTTVAGVLPSGETIRLLALGVVASWKQMLTVSVPVGSAGTLLLPAFLSALVLATIGTLIAVRTRRPLVAVLAPVTMAAGAAVLGSSEAFFPGVAGTALGLATVVWAGWRRRASGLPGLDLRRPVALVAMVVPAAVVGIVVAPMVVPDTAARTIARDVVQPEFDPTTLPSPLAGYRNYVKRDKDKVIVTIEGIPANTPVRLATLDNYDGRLFTTGATTGTFKRVGDRISNVPDGTPVSMKVSIGDYSDFWVPDVGYLSGIAFTGQDSQQLQSDFRYNPETGVGVVTNRLAKGDSYSITASVAGQPTPEQLATAQLANVPLASIAPEATPAEVGAKAEEWSGGAKAPGEVATTLAAKFRELGWVSHGLTQTGDSAAASTGGHGAGRITRLLTAKTMYGDAEQYAVAMALMLNWKKIPARVVMGFRPQQQGGTIQFKGSEMSAWVEVPFADYGWVRFDPVPDETKDPPKVNDNANPANVNAGQRQLPPQMTPPKDPTVQSAEPSSNASKAPPSKPPTPDQKPPQVNTMDWWWAVFSGLGLLVLLLPILLILLLKWRRRRRLKTGPPEQQIAGAWMHLMDTAADFGRSPAIGATRAEAAKELDRAFAPRHVTTAPQGPPDASTSQARASVAVLAQQADSRVFAPEPVAPDEASRYWTEMEQAISTLRGTQSGWRRVRARLSLTSLRSKRRAHRSRDDRTQQSDRTQGAPPKA